MNGLDRILTAEEKDAMIVQVLSKGMHSTEGDKPDTLREYTAFLKQSFADVDPKQIEAIAERFRYPITNPARTIEERAQALTADITSAFAAARGTLLPSWNTEYKLNQDGTLLFPELEGGAYVHVSTDESGKLSVLAKAWSGNWSARIESACDHRRAEGFPWPNRMLYRATNYVNPNQLWHVDKSDFPHNTLETLAKFIHRETDGLVRSPGVVSYRQYATLLAIPDAIRCAQYECAQQVGESEIRPQQREQ